MTNSARFIAQVITDENVARCAEDIGGQELSYAEVKAIASGNPAILTLAEAEAELQRLAVLKRYYLDEQYTARRSVRDLPATIANLLERLRNLLADGATVAAHTGETIVIAGHTCSREDAPAILVGHLESLPRSVREVQRVPLGVYRGLRFGMVLHPQYPPPDVYLEGAALRQTNLSREHHGPRAILNAAERLAGSFDSECDRVRQDLSIAESQFRDYQARLGKPFHHDTVLSELAALRDRLRECLSSTNPEPGIESKSSVTELVDQIKSLKSTTTSEVMPQRIGKKVSSAEVPFTARIRRRMNGLLTNNPYHVSVIGEQ